MTSLAPRGVHCMFACLPAFLPLSVGRSVCLSVKYLYIYIHIYTHLYVYTYIYTCICRYVCIRAYVCLADCLSVRTLVKTVSQGSSCSICKDGSSRAVSKSANVLRAFARVHLPCRCSVSTWQASGEEVTPETLKHPGCKRSALLSIIES